MAGDLTSDPRSAASTPEQFRRHMGTVSRHSAAFFAGTVFTALLGYGFKVYLARALGARALGVYALGTTVIAFVSLFGSLGLAPSALRYVAAYRATGKLDLLRGFLARSLFLLLTINVLLGAAMLLLGPWVAVRFYRTPELQTYLPLFALIMIAGVLSSFLGGVLAAHRHVARRSVITDFIGTPVRVLVTLLLVAAGFGLWGYVVAQAVTAFLVVLLLAGAVWRLTPGAAGALAGALRPLEKDVVAFSGTSVGLGLLGFLKAQSDSVAVGYFLDAGMVGIYSVVAALVAMVPIVQISVNQIFAPTIADLHARAQHDLLRRIFQTITKWVVGLTFPFVFVMIVYAKEFMQIFGRSFESAWLILVIGAVAGLVDCGVGSSGTLLLMSGRQKVLIRIQATTAAMMVALAVILVPRWGLLGAGLAAALNVAITNVWFLIEVRRGFKFYPYGNSFRRLTLPLASAAAVVVVLHARFVVQPAGLGIVAGLVLVYAVFAALAVAVGLDADDRVMARAVWSRLRPSARMAGQR